MGLLVQFLRMLARVEEIENWHNLPKCIYLTQDCCILNYKIVTHKLCIYSYRYHYQHQKQQMAALQKGGALQEDRQGSAGSEGESEDDNDDDNDYTVYECPGLAPVINLDN